MPDTKDRLRETLRSSPSARLRFMSGMADTLRDQGFDIDDEQTRRDLSLGLDLTDGQRWLDDTVASTNIITIVN